MPQKGQGNQTQIEWFYIEYSIEQGKEDKCWRCSGLHKKDCFNPLQATTFNPNPND
jgi:hypothetical protein